MNKFEKIFYTALIILAIFTFGVQVGIHHGRNLEKAEKNFKKTGNRTLIHVENFDKLLNLETSRPQIIAGLKDIMCSTSNDYHSTLIFSTKDPLRLDPIALQPHRINTKIDVKISPSALEKLKSANRNFIEINEKLKTLSKTKIAIGAVIGLVGGSILIGIKHLLSKDKKEG